jgi:hypothetical protein
MKFTVSQLEAFYQSKTLNKIRSSVEDDVEAVDAVFTHEGKTYQAHYQTGGGGFYWLGNRGFGECYSDDEADALVECPEVFKVEKGVASFATYEEIERSNGELVRL